LIDRARTAGANAFVSKRQSYESLKMAIGATQRRETLFPQTASIPHPSERDVALIKMVALGLTSSEIGAAMGLRQRSVEARLLGLYRSQAVSSRGELVARALRKGWIAMQPEDVTTY
jgi:DNA-binding NarL/FixJ family response regulator